MRAEINPAPTPAKMKVARNSVLKCHAICTYMHKHKIKPGEMDRSDIKIAGRNSVANEMTI